jgi:pSer/pThr/pTyr-binding forkhead associated (FHA) protein
VPPFVLTVLQFLFLAVLYLFVYRTVRAVVVDVRGTQATPPPREPSRKGGKGKVPRAIAVMGERGRKVETVPLDGTIQIGRAEACQIQVSDTYVSSFHARVFNRDGAWYVEDLGSTNGTYLNQQRVTSPTVLRVGDRLRVGKTTMELRR